MAPAIYRHRDNRIYATAFRYGKVQINNWIHALPPVHRKLWGEILTRNLMAQARPAVYYDEADMHTVLVYYRLF